MMHIKILKKYDTDRLLFLLAITLLIPAKALRKGYNTVANLEYIRQCPEPEYANTESSVTDIKLIKINGTSQSLSLKMTIKRPWDSDVGFKIDLDVWGYAGWTHVPYIPLQRDFCRKFARFFPDLQDANITKRMVNNCPILPGEYVLRNYTSNSSIRFPFNGRFRSRFIVMAMETKEVILCLLTLVNVQEDVWA